MLVLGLLPIIALVLTIALAQRQTGRIAPAIVVGALAWSLAIVIGTELLGAISAIRFLPVLAAWLLGVSALVVLLVRQGGFGATGPKEHLARAGLALFGGSALERVVSGALLAIAVVTLLIALAYVPTNWDSQTYHLPRIEHWIQNGTLGFYPTAIERQLELATLAETVMLQFHLLSGGDRFDNIVQWLAGAGCVAAAGEIALALGATMRGAAIARLAMAALPMGVLQSTSTQNDLVVTFYILCAAERLLAWRQSRAFRDAAFMAIAAGLAIATKGTAYIAALPFGIWFLVEIVAQGRRALLVLAGCALLLLLPNFPGYVRNQLYSGSPLGAVAAGTNNADWGIGPFAVNAARNAALNLATPWRDVNLRTRNAVSAGLTFLGLDPNDPDLTYPGTSFELSAEQTAEDYAANPLHLLLGVVSVFLIIFAVIPAQAGTRRYALCILAACVVFLILLRWQPWNTRLHLPFFALCAPLAGLLPIYKPRSIAAGFLAAALVATAVPPLLFNAARPLIPRRFLFLTPQQVLFTARLELLPQYRQAVGYLLENNIAQVGLITGGDDWEYPFWRMLRGGGARNIRVEHVALAGRAAEIGYPLGPFAPMAIISTTVRAPEIAYAGRSFRKVLDLPSLALYRAL